MGADDLDGDISINLGTNPPIPRSLQPTQHPVPVDGAVQRTGKLSVKLFNESDSLTRERKGKMPVLSHLLTVGNGTVLSLAADKKYIYAGCQSAENEIAVSCIHVLIRKDPEALFIKCIRYSQGQVFNRYIACSVIKAVYSLY